MPRALLSALICIAYFAGEAAADEGPKASITLERHFTTNALDGPLALDDWYTLLRGSLENTVAHELGVTRFGLEFEGRRYDAYELENDLALGLVAETTMRPSQQLELRGTLSWRHAREGDDFPLGPFTLGTTTDKDVFAAAFQAGIQVAPAIVVVLEATAAREKASPTRFDHNLIDPIELEPDRNRYDLAATVTRTAGPFAYGGAVAARFVHVQPTPANPLAFSLAEYTARAEVGWSDGKDTAFSAAVGYQWLLGESELFGDARPTFRVAFAAPLPLDLSLRGSLSGAFETLDTDDPLASWLRRAELEIVAPLGDRLDAGFGVFDAMKENLVLGNREFSQGAYAMLNWQAGAQTDIYLRLDWTEERFTIVDLRQDTIDIHIGMRARL